MRARVWSLALVLGLTACGPGAATPGAGVPSADGAASATGSPNAAASLQPKSSIVGKIAFSRAGNIWVYAGSTARQVTTIGGAADPAWSPDGALLAFDKEDKNSADLYLLPYPQGSPRALSNNRNPRVENNLWEMQPDWSPDGLALAYVSDRGRLKSGTLDPAAWRVTLSTGARLQLTNSNPYSGGVDFPRWRPDHPGNLLYTSWAYNGQTLQPYGQVILEDTQTNRREALTPALQTSFQPSWSPDGKYVAFVRREQGRDDLRIMPAPDSVSPAPSATASPDGSQLLVQGGVAHPVWAPDGRSIAYIALKDGSFDLFTQAVDAQLQPAGAPLQLTSGWHIEAASAISWGR